MDPERPKIQSSQNRMKLAPLYRDFHADISHIFFLKMDTV
jgi:hypothetical protein